jgi:hypothetical protein
VLSESSGLNAIGEAGQHKDCKFSRFSSSGAMAVQRKHSSAIMDSHLTHCVLIGYSNLSGNVALWTDKWRGSSIICAALIQPGNSAEKAVSVNRIMTAL